MTSTAQVQANRSNAQKSTGPRTAEGKAVAAQNAVRHGLLAKEVVVKGEDPGEFEFYREQMLAELAPAGLDGRDAGPADRRPLLAAAPGRTLAGDGV